MRRRPSLSLLFALGVAFGLARCGGSGTTNLTGPTAARCQATVSNPASGIDSAGGTGTVSVTVGRECSWTASTQASWIEITSGQQGQGDGRVGYRVAANPEATVRTGALMVADRRVDLSQKAGPCRFDILAQTTIVPATGGQTPVGVTANGPCPWTASAQAPWVSLAPHSGTGTAQIDITASPNDGPERTATLSVAGEQLTLRQLSGSAAPAPAPAPPPDDPTPLPPPPPPPAPAPEPIRLHGRVQDVSGSCPVLRFTLEDHLVETTADTEFRRGPCTDLLPDDSDDDGRRVVVDGLLYADGLVEAQRVTFDK